MLESFSFKGGLDLKFFAHARFESLESVDFREHAAIMGRNALRLLMMGWPESWTQLVSWYTLRAVFFQRDPVLLKEFRTAFQQGFDALFIQLEGQILNKEQTEQVQLYLSNCLSLLPYSDLTPYESIRIPQYIDDQWVRVEYYVNPIELTQESTNKLKDHDRVFAYGLEPISNQKAKSHLIFMGTTYPAGQGFLPQLTTDFEAFETVGSSLYLSGRKKIFDWLLRQNDKVHVCGISLGGSLSLLLAIDLGHHLSRVDALNPAGLHNPKKKSKYDRWDKLKSKPQVVIQRQGDDPVSLLGVWKSDWEILQVTPPKDRKGPNPFCDHFMNYAGFAETEFTYTRAEHHNVKRRASNILLYSIGRSAIYYFFISPYNYIIRPFKYFIVENKSPYLILLSTLIGVGALLGLTISGILSSSILLGALTVFGIFSGFLFIPAVLRAVMPRRFEIELDVELDIDFAKIHNPALPRNPDMDIYNKDHIINVELSYKELHSYYKAMRSLVKQKNFLPDDELKVLNADGLSKKEALIESQDSKNDTRVVTLNTTKAKAVLIKHVLTFIDQIGFENERALKSSLIHNYNHYLIGKYTKS